MENTKNIKAEIITGRVIMVWVCFVICGLGYIISNDSDNHMFQFGPNEDLFILGICIDNEPKYMVVVSFCFINSIIRVTNNYVLSAWITHNVQDKKYDEAVNVYQSYNLSLIHIVYNWFDFFMYMNILMSQIDMLLIEVSADLIITFFLTAYYIRLKQIKPIELFEIPCDFEEL